MCWRCKDENLDTEVHAGTGGPLPVLLNLEVEKFISSLKSHVLRNFQCRFEFKRCRVKLEMPTEIRATFYTFYTATTNPGLCRVPINMTVQKISLLNITSFLRSSK
jgi:hypothetical protein